MPRIPKPMTKRRLTNITTHYLSQRTTTRGHLRRLLMNRVRKSIEHHGGDETEMAGWVDSVLDSMVQQGLLNDTAWAESRLNGLMRRGLSERAIRANLRAKLVPAELIDRLLKDAEPDPVQSAVLFARKRRIGPFREHGREASRDKDLGKLARGGFPFDIVRTVLDMDPDEALDLAIRGLYGA
ncbi:MAG: regulatory protein RecX [Myxococcota bacterium]